MDELDFLASDLKTAIGQPVTLSQIKALIENRKIASLKDLFPAEQASNVDKIFYYWDKRGRKQVSEQKVVFADYEYIAVKSEKYSQQSDKYYHAVWVIGVENGKPWVHRLQWGEDFENDSFEWTAQHIRKCMGFQTATTEPYTFELDKTVRIQGDLSLTKVSTIEQYRKRLVIDAVEHAKRKFDSEFERSNDVAIETEQKADVQKATELFKADNFEELKLLRKKYDIHGRRENTDTEIASWSGKSKLLARERERQNYRGLIEKEAQLAETYARAQPDPQGQQVNFRIGNHIIIVANAVWNGDPSSVSVRDGMFSTDIIIYQPTTLVAIHDEHGQTTVPLDQGVYRAGFLLRHRADVSHHRR